MKNHLYKAALVAALGMAGAVAAQASSPASGDVVLGFTSQSAGASADDYLVDLGALPAGGNVAANYNTALNVSGFSESAFTAAGVAGSALGSGGTLYAGLVGYISGGTTTSSIYMSQVDNGSGSPTAAGSGPLVSPTGTALISAYDDATSLNPSGAVSAANVGSFSYGVALNPSQQGSNTTGTGNMAGEAANNPMGTISSSLVFDLWTGKATPSRGGATFNGWTYDGTVTISLANDTLTAIYDEVNVSSVPEPATYGIFGGLGLLVLALRRQLTGKLA